MGSGGDGGDGRGEVVHDDVARLFTLAALVGAAAEAGAAAAVEAGEAARRDSSTMSRRNSFASKRRW